MTSTALRLAAFFALALAPAAAQPGGPAPPNECYSVEQTRQKISQHKLAPPFLALQAARGVHQGDALSARLCHNGEAYFYEIGVLRHDGHIVQVPVDALTAKPRMEPLLELRPEPRFEPRPEPRLGHTGH